MINQLGISTDLDVLKQILTLEDRNIVDIGCGDGGFARILADLGARVTGIEPNPVQAEKNRLAEVTECVKLLEAGAQEMPLEENSQDALIFRFSLHHIPEALYAAVFKEAARVLKPGGQVYIIEPVAEGSSQHVMELFHDETTVRAAAQAAMSRLLPAHFDHRSSNVYEVQRHYVDFDAYFKRYGNLTYNHYAADSVSSDAVKQRFLSHQAENGEVILSQPVKSDLFILRA